MEEKAPSAKEEEGTKDGEQIITITLLCTWVCPIGKTSKPWRS